MKMEYMDTFPCLHLCGAFYAPRDYRFYLVVSKYYSVYPIVFVVPCYNLRVAWRLLKSYLKDNHYKLVEFSSVISGGRIYTKIK